MKYENGFYIYTPNEDNEDMDELNLPQVIQIIEGKIWLTGCEDEYDIVYASALGAIGKMVMNEVGDVL